jgi:hypothetical protein
MKSPKSRLLSGFLLTGALLACGANACLAEDMSAGAASTTPNVDSSPNPTGNGASMSGGGAATTTASGSAAVAGNGAAAAPAAADAVITVAPGPLEDARKILIARIRQAKGEGIGTGNYMLAFTAIEDSVKAGQTADQLKPRVESLARALHDQLEKSKILKTQRPIPVASPNLPPPPDNAAGGPDLNKLKDALGKGGGNKGDLIEKLKDKFGGSIPNIPEGLKDRIPKDILEKLGQ